MPAFPRAIAATLPSVYPALPPSHADATASLVSLARDGRASILMAEWLSFLLRTCFLYVTIFRCLDVVPSSARRYAVLPSGWHAQPGRSALQWVP